MKLLTAKKTLIALLLAFSFYFVSAPLALANADSLIITDDGAITLVIETNVLAASTTTNKTLALKSVSISPANKPTTVRVQSAKTEHKVTVTVTEKPATKPSARPQAAPTTVSTQPQPAPNVISTQTVDRVILQGANNATVVSITPSSQNKLLIQQETVNASTALPINIDSTTHALSAPTAQGEVKLILPKVVLDSVVREGLINASVITASPTLSPQLSLSQDRTGDVVYSVAQSGKLFGVIPVPGTITVANSTGKISAPLFARFLVPFLR